MADSTPDLRSLLEALREGALDVDGALAALRPDVTVGTPAPFATVDISRPQRTGFPEVIFGQGKSSEQILEIMKTLHEAGQNAVATRVEPRKAGQIVEACPEIEHHPRARLLSWQAVPFEDLGQGEILVICAGTSDLPIAEEATTLARLFGNRVKTLTDVGVAGIHRLLRRREALTTARVIVVVAGMEGALASVVAGLTDRPVIAVPTSIGYGASFGGVAALLGMLNSCAPGVSVVNIDNGFGAAYQATLINRLP